jgi:DNA-binding YbaB/EbfC family protein
VRERRLGSRGGGPVRRRLVTTPDQQSDDDEGEAAMPAPQQPNLQQLMKQAQKVQQQMVQAQQELAETQVEGHAAGGAVKATMSGTGELLSLEISPDLVDPDDVETLQDAVIAAVRDASDAAAKLAGEKMGPLGQGLGGVGGLSGLGL